MKTASKYQKSKTSRLDKAQRLHKSRLYEFFLCKLTFIKKISFHFFFFYNFKWWNNEDFTNIIMTKRAAPPISTQFYLDSGDSGEDNDDVTVRKNQNEEIFLWFVTNFFCSKLKRCSNISNNSVGHSIWHCFITWIMVVNTANNIGAQDFGFRKIFFCQKFFFLENLTHFFFSSLRMSYLYPPSVSVTNWEKALLQKLHSEKLLFQ